MLFRTFPGRASHELRRRTVDCRHFYPHQHGPFVLRLPAANSAASPPSPNFPVNSPRARPAFKPSALGTFLVAMGLVAIALLVCLRAGLYFSPVSHRALQWGISAIAVVMFARAIGDSELVGFFKKVSGSRFARLDTWFYSPLCLVLGAGLLVVAWS